MKKTPKKYKITALGLCIALLLPLAACGDPRPEQTQLFAMDTVMTLTAYGKHAEDGLSSAVDVINALDSMLDPDSESSSTSLINNADGSDVILTGQVAEMLDTALEVCRNSGGALDLSVYPMYLAWGGFSEETARIPSDDELSELRGLLHFDELSMMQFPGEANFSVKLPAGTKISFGAVAKGCASDYAVDAMRQAGVESGVVSLGGNVQTLGVKPDGSDWVIAVEDPNEPGAYLGTLSVGETAVVTSGSYQRFFTDEKGNKYHHIINPATGKPADNGLLSVTIVCTDGTLADCLSTAMFVLGEKKAIEYWQKFGGFDMVLVTDDDRVLCTGGLIEMFKLTNTARYSLSMVG